MGKRLGVGNYMLWIAISFIGWSVITLATCDLLAAKRVIDLEQLNLMMSFWSAILGVVVFRLSARRLKDLNTSPWLVKMLAFPLLAMMLMPYLVLVPGSQNDNQYGPAQRSSSLQKVAGAFLLLFLAMNVTFLAVYHYYETKHRMVIVAQTAP